MGVMLQAFYWDCPKLAGAEFAWWPLVAARLPELREAGFTALWLPPCSKAFSTRSMGYDPYDLFDLGEFDQRGGVATWFGDKAQLLSLIKGAHELGMQVYADVVYNHMSGGEREYNPDFEREGYTRFSPKSGRFPRDYRAFHPSRFERWDGQAWGDMPDLCHRNPEVYAALMEHADMLIREVGFDGLRFDFVKGYGAWIIKSILERQYVRSGKPLSPFGVGEAWASDREIGDWLDEVNRWSDNPACAFDFPLRYRLKELCDSFGFSLRRLAEGGTLMRDRPERAVTFVDNHDFRGGDSAPVLNDKLLAYAFILTHPGYPCVFWPDYIDSGLARPGSASGLFALTRVHEGYAGGELALRYVDDDLYIAERLGNAQQPGLIFVLNNRGDHWNGTNIGTSHSHTRYRPAAFWGKDSAEPLHVSTGWDGRGDFWAPPRGYCVYVPE